MGFAGSTVSAQESVDFAELRRRMVRDTIAEPRDGRPPVRDVHVIEAMEKVERHLFVPEEMRAWAYHDSPLGIGWQQTISQPYIVALMTELAAPDPAHKVLEIGTGSGYQAAVLAEIVEHVYTIEIVEPLGLRAAADLEAAGYENVTTRIGDGYAGLARGGAVRCHRRHRGAGPRAGAADRAVGDRRPAGAAGGAAGRPAGARCAGEADRRDGGANACDPGAICAADAESLRGATNAMIAIAVCSSVGTRRCE